MKPPSRKHYQKTEMERLKERIAKLEKERPEALGIQTTIEALRSTVKRLRSERNDAMDRLKEMNKVADWFNVLYRSEVMIPTEEGMKYLVGQDLENYCKEQVSKEAESRIWWSDSAPTAFSGFANHVITEIIRDEVDKCATLDTFKYVTKGRYDTRSKSKKESS